MFFSSACGLWSSSIHLACVTTPWWVEIIASQASHVLLIMKCLDQTRYTAAANVHKLFAASCFLSHVPGSAPLFLQKALMARRSRWDCVKRTQAIYKRYKISPRSGCLAYFFVYVCLCSTCKSNSTAVWKSQNMSRFKDFYLSRLIMWQENVGVQKPTWFVHNKE